MTARWGRPAWIFLHEMAIAFPNQPTEQDKENAKQFLKYLATMLPCAQCKKEFAAFLNMNPPTVDNACNFQTWLFDAHNHVNQRLGKPVFTREQYRRQYGAAIQYHKMGLQ